MERIEHAYYLHAAQLLLLLSIIDQRSVFGLNLGDGSLLDKEGWSQVFASLVNDKRIVYENEHAKVEPELQEILLQIKEAKKVFLWITRDDTEGATEYLLWYCGNPNVMVKALENGALRICSEECLTLELLQKFLKEQMEVFPAEMEEMLEEIDIEEQFQQVEQVFPQFQVRLDEVLQIPEIKGAVDVYEDGIHKSRWYWIQSELFAFIVQQNDSKCEVFSDTQTHRMKFLKEMGVGEGCDDIG